MHRIELSVSNESNRHQLMTLMILREILKRNAVKLSYICMMSSLLRFDHVKLIFNYEMRNNKHKQHFFNRKFVTWNCSMCELCICIETKYTPTIELILVCSQTRHMLRPTCWLDRDHLVHSKYLLYHLTEHTIRFCSNIWFKIEVWINSNSKIIITNYTLEHIWRERESNFVIHSSNIWIKDPIKTDKQWPGLT